MALSYDEISEIFKIIDESSCDEFVLETDDIRLVVRRRGAAGPTIEPSPLRRKCFSSRQRRPLRRHRKPWESAQPWLPTSSPHRWSAPSIARRRPGAPPFVEVGGKVKEGDPIGIIEVMKLFTTIHAEWSGTVTEVGAENATLVEYGQMLFVITPD